LAWRQWRLSAWNPVDRASLKWVFLAILMTMGTCMVVYFLPPILGAEALLPQVAMVGFAAVMYLGLALGVIRYRLFQLEHWWFELWFWFFAGLMLVLVDLGLIWLMQLDQFQALGLAVILVGWAYFPIRQQVWRRLTRRRQDNLIELLPDVVNAMLEASGRQEMESRWSGLLHRAFNPLTLAFSTGDLHRSELASDGESLHVPGLFGGRWMLKYARKGQRLFTLTDIGEANSLWLVARQVGDVRSAREEGAEMERRRIVRDLHDDVGNRLLSLVRYSETPRQEQLARSTLKSLRETMAALDPGREIRLDQLLIEQRDQVRERYAVQAEVFRWSWPRPADMPLLSPRQAINIRRFLDEALGNAINHAEPTIVDIACRLDNDAVTLTVENDGVWQEPEGERETLRGRGMKNMQTRAEEIDATIRFVRRGECYRVSLGWPILGDGLKVAELH
jgi:signal transduction histidine kinase